MGYQKSEIMGENSWKWRIRKRLPRRKRNDCCRITRRRAVPLNSKHWASICDTEKVTGWESKVKMRRVKKKNQEVAQAHEKKDNTKLLMRLKFKGQKRDKEAVNSVFQTSITGVCKRQLSSNRCRGQTRVSLSIWLFKNMSYLIQSKMQSKLSSSRSVVPARLSRIVPMARTSTAKE